MERLTAFEFVAVDEGPQIVCLKRGGETLLQLTFVLWTGVDLRALGLEFEACEDLTIEGRGVGHPYWNDAAPAWLMTFDGLTEAKRILAIRDAALGEARRSALTVM